MYEIRFSEGVTEDLDRIRPYDRGKIIDAIEEHLTHEPRAATRTRKVLANLTPPFEAVPPIWQLRIGEYRVFYDVDQEGQKVYVRAIRRKPPRRTTEEIL